MRASVVVGVAVSFSVVCAVSANSQEKKADAKKAPLTMEGCQEFCDIMSEPGLSADEQKTIQYCVRNNFCNFVKADAPPLGLFQTNRKQANILKWRLKKNSTASFSTQNDN